VARYVDVHFPPLRRTLASNPLANPTPPTDLFYEKRYSHTEMTNPDFVALAKAMHVHAIRCDSIEDLPAKMKEFMEYDNDRPILFDARVVKNEHVYPMVSPLFLPPLGPLSLEEFFC
jgi:hypothetical protein